MPAPVHLAMMHTMASDRRRRRADRKRVPVTSRANLRKHSTSSMPRAPPVSTCWCSRAVADRPRRGAPMPCGSRFAATIRSIADDRRARPVRCARCSGSSRKRRRRSSSTRRSPCATARSSPCTARSTSRPTAGSTTASISAPGAASTTFDVGADWRASVLICADLWNPPLVHLAALQGATLLLAPVSSAIEAVGADFDNPGGLGRQPALSCADVRAAGRDGESRRPRRRPDVLGRLAHRRSVRPHARAGRGRGRGARARARSTSTTCAAPATCCRPCATPTCRSLQRELERIATRALPR